MNISTIYKSRESNLKNCDEVSSKKPKQKRKLARFLGFRLAFLWVKLCPFFPLFESLLSLFLELNPKPEGSKLRDRPWVRNETHIFCDLDWLDESPSPERHR